MKTFKNGFQNKRLRAHKGEILLTTLIFVTLGFLIIVPLLALMGTGLKSSKVYNTKADTLYAADAGVEDAIWQIKYDRLEGTFRNSDPVYDSFDFQTPHWDYALPQLDGQPQMNGQNVSVAVRNVWVPQNVAVPSKTQAKNIINTNKLLVTGGAYGTSSFNIVLTYYASSGENLTLKSIGVWLPPGFTYAPGSSSLEADIHAAYYSNPGTPIAYQGGQVVIWNFNSLVFNSMPDVDTTATPLTTSVTFSYVAAKSGTRPDGVAWVTTGNVDLDGDGVSSGTHFTWDSDVRVFGITSTAGTTSVDTYIAKSEMRKMGGAVNGSYYATGDTLMTGPSSGRTTYRTGVATVSAPTNQGGDNGVPDDANVSGAFLYWSAWKGESGVTRPFTDDASSLTNWTNGGAWADDAATNITGHYYGGADATRDLVKTSSTNMAAYSGDSYIVALSWEQWVYDDLTIHPFSPDTCGTLNNWDTTAPSAWSVSSNSFRGHFNTNKDLTSKAANKVDLRTATPGSVTISWDQKVGGSPAAGDILNYSFSADGTTFPTTYEAFHGNIGNSWVHKVVTIPDAYLTANFRVRFSLVGFSTSNTYAYIDNIAINIPAPTYSASDSLQVSLSKDGGTTWSSYITAFTGIKIGTSPYGNESIYQYNIPHEYLTANFKFKLRVNGFGGLGQHVALDNIKINVMQPDPGVPFKIKVGTGADQQVYFDANGNPAVGSVELTSKRTQAILAYYNNTSSSPTPAGYAFSCYRDVTDLVKAYAKQPVDPNTNFNGQGTYSVVNSTTNSIGETSTALSYAGFSLVLIFTSPETESHQLYLFDTFNGSGQKPTTGLDVAFDFNGDGHTEDNLTGFVVPQRIGNEVNAAKITCFVGEGDVSLSDDYFALNGTKLWDGTTSSAPGETNGKPNNKTQPENVWNGQSLGVGNDGIDIDTLGVDPPNGQYITWDSQIIRPGDTSAQIAVHTRSDYWFMVYMILAFRSETTTGGALSYLIHG